MPRRLREGVPLTGTATELAWRGKRSIWFQFKCFLEFFFFLLFFFPGDEKGVKKPRVGILEDKCEAHERAKHPHRNTQNIFDQMSRHPVAQLSRHIKLTITPLLPSRTEHENPSTSRRIMESFVSQECLQCISNGGISAHFPGEGRKYELGPALGVLSEVSEEMPARWHLC